MVDWTEFLKDPSLVKETYDDKTDTYIRTAKIVKDSRKLKLTTVIKRTKELVVKPIADRRKWPKFGDAKKTETAGKVSATEDVNMEMTHVPLKQDVPVSSQPEKIRCRICNDNHYTKQCTLAMPEDETDEKRGSDVYVPSKVAHRDMAPGNSTKNQTTENTIKVTNIPLDMTKEELKNIFDRSIFDSGPSSAYVVQDRVTKIGRGYGFVTFRTKEDAEKAISVYSNFRVKNLIIHIEWSPRYLKNEKR
ncbi:hypothetical protein SNEBB_007127 [Seison nebaliae]|nr:hypothetical protein SNEBB_007127 [Seison nebaliae]